ncbi:hypothetical protein [Anaeromyxobacter oryzae]|uniref:Hpr(Ser) kinase/phosphatase n=1 Tax=Anaeromyxobacter oryzae TaxID=2918170 RepID=A0ABN6MXH2_9BACT|nr:hypothetical protein [Anaeromyxobacter oryzae]BDG05659.1 hypothetical protein AMOR_46550 [Anaeromyxobacter oryzae]
MSPPAFDVGGVKVEVDAALAAGALLGGFPPASPGPPALVLAVAPDPLPPQDPGAVPSFFHETLRCSVRHGSFRVRDGASVLTVAADGRRIEVAGPTTDGVSELAVLVAVVVALRHHGLFHLHAAALEGGDGPRVLVVGTSGAGKTTLALALAAAGLTPLGDDAVLLTRRGGPLRVVGFPRPFHVGARTAAAFPALAPHLGAPGREGKRPLDARAALGAHPSGAMRSPDLLLLPEITADDETQVEPAGSAEAFGALLESGALLVADGMPEVAEHLAVLRAVADGARTVRVRLGGDVLSAPAACARRLLAAAGRARRCAHGR